MKRRALKAKGFTLVEIMIVVAIIGLLATIAVPQWVHARGASQTKTCINNLRQIDGAVQQWALENKQAPTATVRGTDVFPYLRDAVICPAGGTTFSDSYAVTDASNKPTCISSGGTSSNGHVLTVDTTN